MKILENVYFKSSYYLKKLLSRDSSIFLSRGVWEQSGNVYTTNFYEFSITISQ